MCLLFQFEINANYWCTARLPFKKGLNLTFDGGFFLFSGRLTPGLYLRFIIREWKWNFCLSSASLSILHSALFRKLGEWNVSVLLNKYDKN